MPKRKSASQPDDEPPLRRSTRQKTAAAPATDTRPPKSNLNKKPTDAKSSKPVAANPVDAKKASKKSRDEEEKQQGTRTKLKPAAGAKPKKSSSPATANAKAEASPTEPSSTGRQYWLMKAEPESRIENGVDVKFSIDDLASKTEPEPWDGK